MLFTYNKNGQILHKSNTLLIKPKSMFTQNTNKNKYTNINNSYLETRNVQLIEPHNNVLLNNKVNELNIIENKLYQTKITRDKLLIYKEEFRGFCNNCFYI